MLLAQSNGNATDRLTSNTPLRGLIEGYIYDQLQQHRVGSMWFVWVGVAMIVLKVLDISVFSELSWWWVALPFACWLSMV